MPQIEIPVTEKLASSVPFHLSHPGASFHPLRNAT